MVHREHAQFHTEDVEEVDDGTSVVSGVEDLVQVEQSRWTCQRCKPITTHPRGIQQNGQGGCGEHFPEAVVMKTIPFSGCNWPKQMSMSAAPVVGNCSCCCPRCYSCAAQEVASSARKMYNEGRWEECVRDSEVASNQRQCGERGTWTRMNEGLAERTRWCNWESRISSWLRGYPEQIV